MYVYRLLSISPSGRLSTVSYKTSHYRLRTTVRLFTELCTELYSSPSSQHQLFYLIFSPWEILLRRFP